MKPLLEKAKEAKNFAMKEQCYEVAGICRSFEKSVLAESPIDEENVIEVLDVLVRSIKDNKKLKFMVDNGLGWEDVENDID